MTYFVLLSLTTLSTVLLLPIISLQSSVTIETRLTCAYNTQDTLQRFVAVAHWHRAR